ncbi:tetraacyldisaccharide 4'-kinase [Flavobacterium sp. SOK18b]|uniref:tetraacyldisaccharide 4'-kinase n=1 Tax=Flavobacterium sp. SOK18b TaxID=797900 RepID=UPI0015FDCC58|nr:tetraacyldisaccharide 4'-kinase [Flavobacterium sp. SOK18b]MBB1193320.1 tetraacyldisaccharide 4'-kinase [Flavobacterium sp. SOK18b]
MKLLRKILFPFAVLYGLVTSIRNFLYDNGILNATFFDVPVIVVGNLSVGGTGKSPQIEYLIRLLNNNYKVATLSRGYKRQSSGYILAQAGTTAKILGDEPFQFFSKFPTIQVAVDADRKNGIEQLMQSYQKPDVILLDDAYQHRKVKAGFYILLTAYGDLYADDCMLPTGNLRELKVGAKRASIVIVTKCPVNLSLEEQSRLRTRLKVNDHQELFFTYINYDSCFLGHNCKINRDTLKGVKKVLIAGIAKPDSFFDAIKEEGDVCLAYPDHHDFTDSEVLEIKKIAQNNKIITTEKDYVRLKEHFSGEQLFYLGITCSFISGGENFNKTILDYVGRSTRNS